jgi:hypothetical protein
MMHPVVDNHNVFRQVVVVKFSIRKRLIGSAHYQRTKNTVRLLMTAVAVIEVSALVISCESVSEAIAIWNGTLRISVICESHADDFIHTHLREIRRAVEMLRSTDLSHPVPVNARGYAVSVICEVNDDDVVLAHLYCWTWQLKIDAEEAAIDAIRHDALLVEAV